MKTKLDNVEKEIEASSSSYQPVSGSKRKRIESIIDNAKKVKNINIRINAFDLEKLREKSAMEGLPYQTFIASILHRYVTDQLVDEKNVLKAIRLLKSGR